MCFFSAATLTAASAVEEVTRSAIMSTLSVSIHSRTLVDAMSALFWWSAEITSIGLPSTLPPKSSTAILTASTAPLPDRSEYSPDRSVSTPILTTSSETLPCWASATPALRAVIAETVALTICLSLIVFFPFAMLIPQSQISARRRHSGRRRPSYTQILVQHVHLRFKFFLPDHLDDLSVLHHVVPIGQRRGEAEILLDQHDGVATLLQLADRAPHRLHDHRR